MKAPKSPPKKTDPPTVERLRADIDSGKTGEKVPYPDPAAAPLGSDDEAAGNSPTARQRREAAKEKMHGEVERREQFGSLMLYVLLAVGLIFVILGVFLLLRA